MHEMFAMGYKINQSIIHLMYTETCLNPFVYVQFREIFGLPMFKIHLNWFKDTLKVSGLDWFSDCSGIFV